MNKVAVAAAAGVKSTPPLCILIVWSSYVDTHFGVSSLQIKNPGIAFSLDNELHELGLLA